MVRRDSRSRVRRALLVGLATLLLAACGGGASSGGGATMSWFMWSGSPTEVQAWKHVAALVTQKYPDIHVNFVTASFPDYWTKLQTEAASGSMPCIVSLQSLRTAGFAGDYKSLNQYIRNDHFDTGAFDTSIMQGLTFKGQQLALPYDFGPGMIFYNQDMFQRDGVPIPQMGWTADEFFKDARALTHGKQYGMSLNPGSGGWLPFALSNGANYLTSDGKLDFANNPALARAFQTYVVDLTRKDHASPQWPSTSDPLYATEQWQAGNAAMLVDGPWDIINFKGQVKFKLGIAPVPTGSKGSITTSAGSGFGISRDCKTPDQAWKAIQVLTGPDAEKYLATQGRAFAARKADQQYWYQTAGSSFRGPLEAALKNAVPFKTTTNWNQADNLMLRYGVAAMNGQMSGAEALQQVQSQAGQG